MHGFSLALSEIPSVGSCEMMAQEAHKHKAEGESGRVRAQHDRWIEPGAGLEFSDTLEVPPPHNSALPFSSRACANIFPGTNRCASASSGTNIAVGITHFKSGHYGDVLAMAAQPDIRGSCNTCSADPKRPLLPLKSSILPDLKVLSAKKERRRSPPLCNPHQEDATMASEPRLSLPHARCPIHCWDRHLPGAARRRSDVAALHPHAAQGHRRARHRLDAPDPAGPGGMRAEVEGKQFGSCSCSTK
ncbi:hypothetical protein EDB85DRAFT_2294770 [Lactarius pseudohatsudake]|nr:hypothetical protein EDB85DRAFT_2294770 [Lactarius pseudohatsudake]